MTFLSASFLFGLFALPIPFLIHLWHRHRLKRIWFPSISLLERAEQGQKAFRKLKDIILLILRTLALLFLVLAFADPLLLRRQKTAILDDSWDMLTKSGNSTVFEKAEKQARSLRNTAILLASGESYPSPCKYQKFHLPTEKMDYVITRAGKLPDAIDPQLIEIDYEENDFSVDSIETSDHLLSAPYPQLAGKSASSLLAFVRNRTSQGSSQLVTLSTEIRRLEMRLSMAPYTTGTAIFPVSEACAGSVRIEESDALQLDNTRYFVWSPPRALKALIAGEPDDVFFLKNALSPARGASRIDVQTRGSLDPGTFDKSREQIEARSPGDSRLSACDVLILVGHPSSGYGKTISIPSRAPEVRGVLTISKISEDHPIFRGFEFVDELKHIAFTHRKRSETRLAGTVIASFSDGSPAIVEHDSGGLEFFFPVSLASKELVLSPLFPPLLHRIAYYTAGKPIQRYNFDVGELVRIEVPEFKTYECTGGEKQVSLVPTVSGTGIHVSLVPEMPGIYDISGIAKFAVNISNSLVYPSLEMGTARRHVSIKKWFFLVVLLLLIAELIIRRGQK